jgi:hypothetical protein
MNNTDTNNNDKKITEDNSINLKSLKRRADKFYICDHCGDLHEESSSSSCPPSDVDDSSSSTETNAGSPPDSDIAKSSTSNNPNKQKLIDKKPVFQEGKSKIKTKPDARKMKKKRR